MKHVRIDMDAIVAAVVASVILVCGANGQSTCASTLSGSWFPSQTGPADGGLVLRTASNASGDVIAIAARYEQAGLQTGAVWVVRNWPLQQAETRVVPSSIHDRLAFGAALAMDALGDVLAVGAPETLGLPGNVFVYRNVGGNWLEEFHFADNYSDRLGVSLAISADGETVVSGAPFRDLGAFDGEGAILTFRRHSGVWSQDSILYSRDLPQSNSVQHVGAKLAMSPDGRWLAARLDINNNVEWNVHNGAVYILERTGANWTYVARLKAPVQYSINGFGQALAFSHDGSVLIAGDYQDSRLSGIQGAAWVCRRGPGGWYVETSVLPTQVVTNGVFGQAVAINGAGDRMAIGMPGYQLAGTYVGAVEEFEYAGGAWASLGIRTAPIPQTNSLFGGEVAMNRTGGRWIASEPLSDTVGVDLGELHVFDAACLTPTTYCTAQTNTLGCAAQIGAQGTPSVSSTGGFAISASNVRNIQNGMLLYGVSGRAAIPWLGGTLCVAPPLRRTPIVNSGGSLPPANDCSGVLVRDFNAWLAASNDVALFAGQHVRAQFYSRDPGAPAGLNLSDAIEFYLES